MKKEIIILALMIFSSIFFITPNIEWDEYVYLMNAKHFAGQSIYFENIRPPMLSLITSIFYSLGIESIIFPAVPLIIFAFFLLSLYLFSKDSKALILMFSFPIFLMYIQKLMTSILGASFVLLSLFFLKEYFSKKKDLFFYSSFFFSGMAFLSRYPLGINLASISILYIVFSNKKDWSKLPKGFAAFMLPIIPWVMHIGAGSFITAFTLVSSFTHFPESLNFFHYFYGIIPIFGISIASLLFFKNYKYKKNDLFFIIPLALIFAAFQLISNKEDRYLIPLLPFCAIFFSGIMKKSRHFILMAIIFFSFSILYSRSFYGSLCSTKNNLLEFNDFFKEKENTAILSNFWPICSYYSNNPCFAVISNYDFSQRIIETNASYIAVSSFCPNFDLNEYSNYEIIKTISADSCETINIYAIE
ncbi:MAG: glycosyltransferase family 39 protein [Candidatus Nanoarchaeia archaeon]|nr:glycosyltransferase family 39 protein [Candidatus Nanoarchaeia archaeon]MDD5053951.1 glycosyltransferase family 39 protein [Candidatus Nanoarchaeia archaeon]MDD5499300.1 glycosyltransferase family 39 protein [Candidatus Nanoarchaeia archaeon]